MLHYLLLNPLSVGFVFWADSLGAEAGLVPAAASLLAWKPEHGIRAAAG